MSVRESSKVGSWTFDFTKKLFFATNETYQIFGREPNDFDGSLNNVISFIILEDRESFVKAMEAAYRGIPLNTKFRIITKEADYKFIHARAELFYNLDRSQDVMIGTVQDVNEQLMLEKNIEELNLNLHYEPVELHSQGIGHTEREDLTKMVMLKNEAEQKLLEIERTQKSFLLGSWELDFATMTFIWSDVTYEIYGMDPANGAPDFDEFIDKIVPDDRALIIDLLNNMPKESPFEVEFRINRNVGDVRHIKHLVEVVFDSDGNPKTIRGNIQDITHQKEMELKITKNFEELKRLRKRLDLMADTSNDVFEIIDATGLIKYISPSVENMMGLSSSEIEGHYIWDFVEGDEKEVLKTLFNLCIAQPKTVQNGSVKSTTKHGEIIFLEVTMNNHLDDSEVNGIVLNWKDITSKVELDDRVHHLANYDELTGLPNRSYFKEFLSDRVNSYSKLIDKFGVFMIDIDEFKGINNVLSFEFGDHMINKIGAAIKDTFKTNEVFLSRFYGDQFGLIVDHIEGVTDGTTISERILSIFNDSFVIGQYELYVTASIGFSIYPDDGRERDTLIKNANIALSRAKDLGKQKYQAYSPLIDIKSFKDFSLRNDLKKAIENRELEVYYQPIVNLETGEIIAGEALSRWNHPEWGMVPPLEFIPIAESTGLIIPMGKWLLDQVCEDYKAWREKGLPEIKVSVNFSVLQFYQVNFVKEILETIHKHALKPKFMILEITESVLINQSKQTEKDLAELKRNGIQIAIDDFGTGYSSLTYLSAMNVDILKIDRSFIDELPKRDKSEKILIAIINLAKDLNMKIVAEGVSEWTHLHFLRSFKCFAGQGYLFSRPVPNIQFEAKLAEGFIQPESEETSYLKPEVEKRQVKRINLNEPIQAEMTIIEMNHKHVEVGQTKSLIKDIGLSGISFITNVKFPVKDDIVLQFRFELQGVLVEVQGTVVWTEELEPGKHVFGFEFIESEENVTQVANVVSVLLNEK